jgi:hypothetical protein
MRIVSMSRRPWFYARTHFWGWNPASWEGWMVFGVYFAALIGWLGYVAWTRDLSVGVHADPMPLVPVLALTAAFVGLCKLKSV